MTESRCLKDNFETIRKFVRNYPLGTFEIENLRQVLRLSRLKTYEGGECIIQKEYEMPYIYCLLAGKVRVEQEGKPAVTVEDAGELFGEFDILKEIAIPGAVYVESDQVFCLEIDISPGLHMLPDDSSTGILLLLYRILAEYLSSRLRMINQEMVSAKKEIENLRKMSGETAYRLP